MLTPASTARSPRPLSHAATRVLVVEDHALLAEVLAMALRSKGYGVVCLALPEEGPTRTDLPGEAIRHRPHIALVDLDLGRHGDGRALIAPLAAIGTDVVVVTGTEDPAEWGGCLHRGARAVLCKGSSLQNMVTAIDLLGQGRSAMSREVREDLVSRWRVERADQDVLRDRLALLTSREREVLEGLVAGHGIRDIAAADVVSAATVRTQVKSILGKLEVSSQLAAVGLVHRASRARVGLPRWSGAGVQQVPRPH